MEGNLEMQKKKKKLSKEPDKNVDKSKDIQYV